MDKFACFSNVWKLFEHVRKEMRGNNAGDGLSCPLFAFERAGRERLRGRGISYGGKCGVTDFQMECLPSTCVVHELPFTIIGPCAEMATKGIKDTPPIYATRNLRIQFAQVREPSIVHDTLSYR